MLVPGIADAQREMLMHAVRPADGLVVLGIGATAPSTYNTLSKIHFLLHKFLIYRSDQILLSIIFHIP